LIDPPPPVPEPSALILFGTILVLTGWFLRRRLSTQWTESGRQAHLNGPIAHVLMEKAPDLFAKPPAIEEIEVLGAKLP
jgi:hypothetical protein